MKRLFSLKEVIITIILFVMMWGLSFIPINCKFLSPVKNALADFDVYDIVFSKLREESLSDTNIVLVNIGNLSRREIAQQIEVINKYQPKVIGIDALFHSEKDPEDDSLLCHALSQCRNLVMVSKLDKYSDLEACYAVNVKSIEKFSSYAYDGFANLPDDVNGGFRTIREFRPIEKVKNTTAFAFSTKIAELYNPEAADKLLQRNIPVESINFMGNFNKFYFIDAHDLLTGEDFGFLTNKIVLMGYMGPDLNTKNMDDIFFTPLNERYAGKSFPDMYGIVIHANIISMILRGDYINRMPAWLSFIIIVLTSFINIKLLLYIKSKNKDWFSGLTKIFIFLFTIFILYLSVVILQNFNYKLNLTFVLIAVALSTTTIDLYENYFVKISNKLPNVFKRRSTL